MRGGFADADFQRHRCGAGGSEAWQNRPLEEFYPIVYMDALRVKMRDEGQVENRAVYVAIGVNLEGQKEVLGLWAAETKAPSSGCRC